MKRQIIKTRSDRPYRLARIVIALTLAVLIAVTVYALVVRPHVAPAHGAIARHTTAMQDLANPHRNPRSPIILN